MDHPFSFIALISRTRRIGDDVIRDTPCTRNRNRPAALFEDCRTDNDGSLRLRNARISCQLTEIIETKARDGSA
jgi:hypothetical protein